MSEVQTSHKAGAWSRARALAERTPEARNRYVDFLRAVSIMVVVGGHWLLAAAFVKDGRLELGNMLHIEPRLRWLTWALQVMPVFFIVGGYANAASWEAARRTGLSYGLWAATRLRRLVGPVVPLLIAWSAIGTIAHRWGVSEEMIRVGSQVALVPTWFLAVYIMVVIAVPATHWAWRRFGVASFWALAFGAVLVDTLAFAGGVSGLRWANYAFVWLSVHQLGYAWRDGRIARSASALAWAAAGMGLLIFLVAVAKYPVSMVTVPGEEVSNSLPPTLALLALGVFQGGLLLALQTPARRWLDRPWAWTGTVLVNGTIMTLYLWHVTVMALMIGLLNLLGRFGIGLEPNSLSWWATRPLWIAFLAVVLSVFLAVFGRFEQATRGKATTSLPSWRVIGGSIAVCSGLAVLALHGIGGEGGLGIRLGTVLVTLVGAALVLGSPFRRRATAAPRSGGPGLIVPALLLGALGTAPGWLVHEAAAQQAPRTAAQANPSLLTLEKIFTSGDLFPERFGPVRWLSDGTAYTTLEPSERGAAPGSTDIVRYNVKTGDREVMVPADWLVPRTESAPLAVEAYEWSPDRKRLLVFTNSKRVWRRNTRGDFWVLDLASHSLRKLGGPDAAPSTLMFAKFSPDGGRVAYVRENDLYVEDLAGEAITRLTTDGSPTIIDGTSDWVYEEELDVRDGFRWSPDGARIAYWQFDVSGVRDFLLIDDTDSLYSYTIPVQYPKAGTTNSSVRVGVVSAEGGPTTWLSVPGDPRNHYIARLDWAASSDEVALQQLNRLQNTDRVMLGDAATGEVRTVLTERDSAWVDVVDDMVWLDGGQSFTWVSERDGWRHVYRVSRDGRQQRLITRGAFDVASVEKVDEAGGWLYYIASPENAAQRYLFRSRLSGKGEPERLSPVDQPGTHSYDVAPDARHALHTYSSFDSPPVVELVSLPGHVRLRTLVDNVRLRERMASLKRGHHEFFQVDADDGTPLDGWMMKPPGFDPAKKYPIVFYVYGEPAAVTVTDRWNAFYGLWFLMLTQQGYIVASVDNRGTPSLKGRKWRKTVYGRIGVLASKDQAAAARALARRPYVDATRIGVWGWSGGGSMTLNLLFRSPELYAMGMSVAPVPDQRLYDTIYQERYMGLPEDNAEGYRLGSPITFADRLQGKLLLIHGSGDDNVHYQGTERLVNALVAADKPFRLMVYPSRTHCICEGRGTYPHLFGLLTRFLHENLPAGGR